MRCVGYWQVCVYVLTCVSMPVCTGRVCVCVCVCVCRGLCVCVNAQALWSAAPVTPPLGIPWSLLPHKAGSIPFPDTKGWPYGWGTFGGYPLVLLRLLVTYLSSPVNPLHALPRRGTALLDQPWPWPAEASSQEVGAPCSLSSSLLWASLACSFLGCASFLHLLVHSLIHSFNHSLSIKDSYTGWTEWWGTHV